MLSRVRNVSHVARSFRIPNISTKNVVRNFKVSNVYTKPNSIKILEPIQEFKRTHLENIDNNQGLRNYMKDIYKYSGLGFGTTLGVGSLAPFIVYSSPILAPYTIPLWIGNVGFSFYSIYKLSKLHSTTKTIKDKNNQEQYIEEINPDKKLWYSLFSVSNGITISPAIGVAIALSPTIMPTAIVGTLGIFGGASLYALNRRDLQVATWQGPLIGCVTGLIGASLVQLGFGLAGYKEVFDIMNIGVTGVSLVTFTGLVAADTQVAIRSYLDRNLDSIKTSVDLLLDATNILLDLIKILSEIMKASRN